MNVHIWAFSCINPIFATMTFTRSSARPYPTHFNNNSQTHPYSQNHTKNPKISTIVIAQVELLTILLLINSESVDLISCPIFFSKKEVDTQTLTNLQKNDSLIIQYLPLGFHNKCWLKFGEIKRKKEKHDLPSVRRKLSERKKVKGGKVEKVPSAQEETHIWHNILLA